MSLEELEVRRITEKVLKEQNLYNLAELYKKEHDIFRGTHKELPLHYTKEKIDALFVAKNEFKELTDTPSSYVDQGGKGIRVKGAEDGLEFYTLVDTDELVKVGAEGSADYLNENYFERDASNHIRIKQGTLLSGVNVEKLNGQPGSYYAVATHGHAHGDLTGVSSDQHHPQAHTLASHSTKAHSELTGVTSDLHHPQLHAASHHVAGADLLAFASITGFATYLDQAVKQASSPTFAGMIINGNISIKEAHKIINADNSSAHIQMPVSDVTTITNKALKFSDYITSKYLQVDIPVGYVSFTTDEGYYNFDKNVQAPTAKLTDLTDGYVPYHISDVAGLANSGIFWDSVNSRVGIGRATPSELLHLQGAGSSDASMIFQQIIASTAAYSASPVSGLMFYNKYTSGGSYAGMGGITVGKENVTDGNLASYVALHTRVAAGAITERVRIDSFGNVGIGKIPTCALDVEGTVQVSTLTASQLLGTGTSKELKSLTTITGLTTGHVLKATGASSIAFQANNLAGLSDITLGTPIEASLLCYYQAGGFWYAGRPEYDIRYKSYDIEWEFWTASPPSPWASGAVSGGSASGIAATSHHPGSIAAYSGTAADSGYYWIAANNNLILSGVEQADFIFKTASSWDSRMNRFGFQDSITITAPTDGAYLDLNGRYLTGKTIKAGVGSTTGTGYNTSGGIWYRGRIIVNADATLITFLLYDAAGNQLWTNTLATNIPTAPTGFGALGYYTVAATGTHIITMDLAYLVCARGLVR